MIYNYRKQHKKHWLKMLKKQIVQEVGEVQSLTSKRTGQELKKAVARYERMATSPK